MIFLHHCADMMPWGFNTIGWRGRARVAAHYHLRYCMTVWLVT